LWRCTASECEFVWVGVGVWPHAGFLSLPSLFLNRSFLTGTIESFSRDSGLGQALIGMIILPIAGNACEHMAAVVMAAKNKARTSGLGEFEDS
jgi:hypothetical protein